MKIILDAMGGDYAPQACVLGAIDAINKDKNVEVVLVGKKDEINATLAECKYDKSRIEIVDASDVISNDESPTMAIKLKKDSSLVVAYERLMSDENCKAFVSAGSTGAVLVGAFMKVGRIKGVSRPALAPVLPTLDGKGMVLCDCGANVDSKPLNLLHFAIMASSYAQAMLGVENPRVGLLNNGVEAHKGNELTKQAYELLSENKDINFAGNCEARDMLSGNFDVVVADGFDGNIALKTAEGTANLLLKLIKKGVYDGGLKSKLGGAMLKPVFKEVKATLDFNARGGACFLGVNKVVVKAHGASERGAIGASILQAKGLAEKNICEKIKAGIDASVIASEQ
ncbi:MAG: phosphate acyltransferase PlsX [Bacteroides sp.]|nr:phosphate acyltransferase PlsX [Bacillota bacterium]MCM1393697.1 phosphate acyltransferase PlsX [[Eubacterium] siraeum]MCM1456135.1 phosphate acyltransferase PlsX [Bacteroides sp.]